MPAGLRVGAAAFGGVRRSTAGWRARRVGRAAETLVEGSEGQRAYVRRAAGARVVQGGGGLSMAEGGSSG